MGVKWVYCKAAAHRAWLLDTGFRRYDARYGGPYDSRYAKGFAELGGAGGAGGEEGGLVRQTPGERGYSEGLGEGLSGWPDVRRKQSIMYGSVWPLTGCL